MVVTNGFLRLQLVVFVLLWFCGFFDIVDSSLHAKQESAAFEAAQMAVDCDLFLDPIRQKRATCHNASQDSVNTCTYFASDYRFIVPFLVHHLTLGVNRMYIYNNDEKVAWYNHPAVMCMVAEQMVVIQPWWGERLLIPGLNHCFHTSITNQAKRDGRDLARTWAAVFDIDEMLVLHKHQCINTWVEDVAGKETKAPGVAVNWAFFTPEGPKLTNFGRTGNANHQFGHHGVEFNNNNNSKRIYNSRGTNKPGVAGNGNHTRLLPHEMLTRRMYEKNEIKTISRIGCSNQWTDQEHCPGYNGKCGYGGTNLLDPEKRSIHCGPWTPYVDNAYPNAQLNHYWTLSLADFLRKIHRGKGGSYMKTAEHASSFRNTEEFFDHGTRKEGMVTDTSFLDYYGSFFRALKTSCPDCFETKYHYLVDTS